ncbi:acyl--CoA ligase [Frankia sp. CNm7]|uniref:Acyl--CoA ligase n=1 Tax=Frankia nepalensis TaxID=1836974 RepID=A0A937RK79_9ACTN|nr:class I adenylate-forming enzyme family protein [Frankia nepalensis]MBL7500225.1 acyl--CoA ligase [Frankia nepalensis]MBL7514281.1 acyl--CoA ligase [Frankia nepalensis]MBL7523754.1 acyl--CoA ligase [Frankia nepalensis]MBL7631687.1 acyl--CoA ligase [Frankia nepalensis]
MTRPTVADDGLASVYRDDPRLAPFIGPGGPFEVESVLLDGVPLRDFVRAPRTVNDIFLMGAAHEALTNIVYGDERLTFAQVRRQARALAGELRTAYGVRPGDRVAIAMRNLPEFVTSFWGAALAGAIVTPLNSWWTGPELGYALRDAGVSVLFADDERLARVRSAGRPDGLTLVGVRSELGDVPFADLAAAAPIDDDAIARLDRDDPVTLLFTSGTTGRPKGAISTNRATMANIWNMAFTNLREGILAGRPPRPARQPTTLSTAPLFHIGGVTTIFSCPLGGAKIVLMRRWDVEEAIRLAEQEQVTAFGGVPPVARQILEHPRTPRLRAHVQTFSIGGAAVPPDLVARTVEVFGDGIQLLNGYGLTETTSAVVTNVGVEFQAHPDCVGRPNLTADVRVVGAHGVLDTGEVGELCFRSPQVARGYWNDATATAASFRDGWFHSGDVGFLDADGYVHVVDRMKDVVIRGGENVYCAEVEAVLHEHPGVAEVTVIGLAEPALGERVCAVVVPRPGATLDLDGLRAFAADRLAAFKCPEALHLLAELPKTATGKVAKNEVRAQVTEAMDVIIRAW